MTEAYPGAERCVPPKTGTVHTQPYSCAFMSHTFTYARRTISVGTAARLLNLHPSTIRRALQRGDLDGYRAGERGALPDPARGDPRPVRPYDPPIGTIVLGNEQVIYLGNGKWQPLDEEPRLAPTPPHSD